MLESSRINGIPKDNDSINKRSDKWGNNHKPKPKIKNFFQLCLDALKDLTVIILLICAIVGIAIGIYQSYTKEHSTEWIDGTAILMAVFIIVMVTAFNDYQKEKQFRKLTEKSNDLLLVNVTRDNKTLPLNICELLVGDIVDVAAGIEIPSDGILFESNNMEIDESSMTGESNLVKKSSYDDSVRFREK
jgi:Ca2+ transporting ATPase